MANIIIHKSTERGAADHGWLQSRFSFSFANYYHPEKIHFGVLRVLNDDRVAPSMGFGKHPHDNMEIVSIPLSGALEHRDSMGNTSVIRAGEVQVMSAGTGVAHSEYNHSSEEDACFLQIWIFPRKRNLSPRYDQKNYTAWRKFNEFYQILSPNPDELGVWVHQDAWFHLGEFDQQMEADYSLKGNDTGVYAFVLEGSFEIEGHQLDRRDAMGISDVQALKVKVLQPDSKILLMEVPMQLPVF